MFRLLHLLLEGGGGGNSCTYLCLRPLCLIQMQQESALPQKAVIVTSPDGEAKNKQTLTALNRNNACTWTLAFYPCTSIDNGVFTVGHLTKHD